ncbi:MAG: glycosyltransferase family 39 protein [Nitrospira sp.]|nr:glycosyltransferase family 39 protein [Nitrospira sp.]
MSTRNLVLSALLLSLIRVALIIWGGQHDAPGGDQLAFYSASQQLAHSSTEWLKGGGEFGYRAPVYFVYLAGVFNLVPGSTFLTGQIATALIGVLNCVLIFVLIRNLTDDAGGKLGFWLRGLLPSYVVADTFVMSEPLFATFLLSALVIISFKPNYPDSRQALALGVLIACCLLTREVAIVYPIVFGGYLVMASGSRQDALRLVALFAMTLLITLTPWMWRNVIVWGQPLPISYTSGVNLHIGNNPEATGKWVRFSGESDEVSLGFGTPQSDAWHRQEALKYIQEDPVHFMRLGFKKVAWFLWPRFEREEVKELYKLPARQATLLSGLLGVLSASVMIVGIAGFVFGRRDWFWWVSAILIAYTIFVTFVVYGSPRYRDAVDYLLLVFAANATTRWRSLWMEIRTNGSSAQKQLLILIPVLSYVLINWVWIAYDLTKSGH